MQERAYCPTVVPAQRKALNFVDVIPVPKSMLAVHVEAGSLALRQDLNVRFDLDRGCFVAPDCHVEVGSFVPPCERLSSSTNAPAWHSGCIRASGFRSAPWTLSRNRKSSSVSAGVAPEGEEILGSKRRGGLHSQTC